MLGKNEKEPLSIKKDQFIRSIIVVLTKKGILRTFSVLRNDNRSSCFLGNSIEAFMALLKRKKDKK